jgi:hypothetical protein
VRSTKVFKISGTYSFKKTEVRVTVTPDLSIFGFVGSGTTDASLATKLDLPLQSVKILMRKNSLTRPKALIPDVRL